MRAASIRAGDPPPHPVLAGGYRALASRVEMPWQEVQSIVMNDRKHTPKKDRSPPTDPR